MIDAMITSLTMDLPKLPRDKHRALLQLGCTCEDLGVGGVFRWQMPAVVTQQVEAALGERILFNIQPVKHHIAEVDYSGGQVPKLSISLEEGAYKFNEMQATKAIVSKVLASDLKARGSDWWLILQVLRYKGVSVYANLEALDVLPQAESITRCRRLLQNTYGMYKPAEYILEQRAEAEEIMREIPKWDDRPDEAINEVM